MHIKNLQNVFLCLGKRTKLEFHIIIMIHKLFQVCMCVCENAKNNRKLLKAFK